MIKKISNHLFTPILLSLTIAIILISLNVIRRSWDISFIISGALMGTLLLELEYIFFIYFLEPQHPFSKTVRQYFYDKDFTNGLRYIYHHKPEIKNRTLQSALFQVCLAALTVYVASSDYSVFIKALLISAYANSIYKMSEFYFSGEIDSWFWMLKEKPNKNNFYLYCLALLILLIMMLMVF